MTAPWALVARKELGDLLGRIGAKPLTRTIGVVAIFGVLVPLRFSGVAYLPAFFAAFMAFLPARLVAIDAFAGERERGTLESLLASPLPDQALVVGKTVAASVYGALRGWLFLAMWAAAAAFLRAVGIAPDATVPAPGLLLLAAIAAAVVAYAASVFGVWQSAKAPSVRAIVESGGLLRLVIIVTVFFLLPWLLGMLSPDGQAPTVPLPGTAEGISFEGLRAALVQDARTALSLAVGATALGGLWLWRLSVGALRRGTREELSLVTAPGGQGRGSRRPRARANS
jgi:ABC-2 type transport system permease protein